MSNYRCGCRARIGDGTAMLQLPFNRSKYFVHHELPNMSRDDIAKYLEIGVNDRWGSVCDFRIERTNDPNSADWHITVANLGGGGILADQELPYRGMDSLTMRINSRVQWTATDGPNGRAMDIIRVLTHESGHYMGHQHFPQGKPDELMEPYIFDHIIGPQPTEAAVSARWFGAPVVVEPDPPPVPTPGKRAIITGDFEITYEGGGAHF